ncbi:uncharacterized protein LOC113783240 [Coffea eugenioides]|uniref:uncharacterized protein LOC113783240 n=1 Tax=Coffea eugenioides TaxID=49369 RepID=UPI000F607A87|nr:uncharacterized protein LOC113783240 [Coffea eugenioides]
MGVMKPSSVSAYSAQTLLPLHLKSKSSKLFNPINLKPSSRSSFLCPYKFKPFCHFVTVASSEPSPVVHSAAPNQSRNVSFSEESETQIHVEQVGSPLVGPSNFGFPKLSTSDQAFSLLLFIAVTTTASLVGFLAAAIPTLSAMRRAAISVAKLADTARQETPSTMAAIRLTSLEISDLTYELRDLSQEITDGVSKSAQAVQAANAGIRQIGSLAREQTMSMIEERANLPDISLQPVFAGAAQKTSHAVGRATRTFMNIISKRETSLENEDASALDSLQV